MPWAIPTRGRLSLYPPADTGHAGRADEQCYRSGRRSSSRAGSTRSRRTLSPITWKESVCAQPGGFQPLWDGLPLIASSTSPISGGSPRAACPEWSSTTSTAGPMTRSPCARTPACTTLLHFARAAPWRSRSAICEPQCWEPPWSFPCCWGRWAALACSIRTAKRCPPARPATPGPSTPCRRCRERGWRRSKPRQPDLCGISCTSSAGMTSREQRSSGHVRRGSRRSSSPSIPPSPGCGSATFETARSSSSRADPGRCCLLSRNSSRARDGSRDSSPTAG